MAAKPDNQYGSFGSVPDTVSEGGSGAQGLSVHANAADFGGQVAQSLEQAGSAGEKLGSQATALATQYAEEATRAKVDDTYANQYAPTAAALRQNFDQLQGTDKLQGYQDYVKNLQDSRTRMLADTKSPYEHQLLSSQIDRHITNEIDGANRELGPALTQYANSAKADSIKADADYAISNYNNPKVVQQTQDSIDGKIQLKGMDSGASDDEIEQDQRQAKADVANGMLGRALQSGDINTANLIYQKNSIYMPGYQQLQVEKTLHAENIRQTGAQGADALVAGKPLPPAVGYHPPEVQAAIANTAQSSGVDANSALTVARIESNYGQNVGSRGDIGQTGKPGNLQEQAKNLCDALKSANDTATKQLGRPAEPWEAYAVYQQGAGGGPALLLTAQRSPTDNAVETLEPLYKNPKDALSAIVNNGGNATMTCGQFLDMIKQKYNDNAARAACDFPQAAAASVQNPEGAPVVQTTPQQPNLGDAIMAPHQGKGIPVQPAATPVQALTNFDQSYPDALMRANQIPNVAQREGVIKALEQKRNVYVAASNAWKQQFQNKAAELGTSPDFTSMDQVPSDMKAALADSPQTLTYLETRAKDNLDHSTGAVTKDQKEYGAGFYKLFSAVHAPISDPNRISDITQLQSHVGPKGDLSLAGYDRLTKDLQGKGTPDGDAENEMKKQTFKVIKQQVSGEDIYPGMKDPKGEEIYAHAMPLLYKAIEDGKSKNIPASELYDPQSKNYIGLAVKGLVRDPSQWHADLAAANLQDGGGQSIPAQAGDTTSGPAPIKEDSDTLKSLEGALSNGKLAGPAGMQLIQDAYKNGKISRATAMEYAISSGNARRRPVGQ